MRTQPENGTDNRKIPLLNSDAIGKGDTMEENLIISDACIGCGQCTKLCIRGHLGVGEDKKVHEIESPYYCFECGHCMSVCPKGAISFRDSSEAVAKSDERIVSPEALSELFRSRRSKRWFDRNCTREELETLLTAVRYAPTAENSQAVQYAVIQDRFPEFMALLADILRTHTDEHPRLKQFVDYVDGGMKEKNNPFTWEGRQIIIGFSRIPIDAIIPMEQLELLANTMGLGGFHSRWMLLAAEHDPRKFMSFFPEIREDLTANAVFIIGHPRVKFRTTVPRKDKKVLWM